ncbi:L,D-transpeptidase family protein [Puia sp. P3]|uniref:L,D-transpeptidase family protein n=1 Tax=Puia sp. P3 TaxID=3423952 RepID=UPI003D67A2C4
MWNFYNSRNFQFAWFDEEGLSEHGEAFWNLYLMYEKGSNDSLYSGMILKNRMESLEESGDKLSWADLKETELQLTKYFFKYLSGIFDTKLAPEEMQWHIPRRKINATAVLDSFLAAKKPRLRPLSNDFYKLQEKLIQYDSIKKKGGWELIDPVKRALEQGAADPVITQVKRRLAITGELLSKDTSQKFTRDLRKAVIGAQRAYGLRETGVINQTFVQLLNVPIITLIRKMEINLDRMRWMPQEGPDRIIANIPEFGLHVFSGGKPALSMSIVAGQAAHQTVIFSDSLQYIVFSPYWNIPASIVKREILPAIKADPGYLSRNNMEITGNAGDLPLIRQRPGVGNALGKVKFIFPNRYHIYFHDTPAKTLFNRKQRAFSHGCIRLSKPYELACFLLRADKAWNTRKIRLAMNRNNETWVKLDTAIPVFIVYFTAWVDEDGRLNFRDDVYGHDRRMEAHLFN